MTTTDTRALAARLAWHRWRKEASEKAIQEGTLTAPARIAAQRTVVDAVKQITDLERKLGHADKL
jgi:hypothetical protein